jgi:hypothetical protein
MMTDCVVTNERVANTGWKLLAEELRSDAMIAAAQVIVAKSAMSAMMGIRGTPYTYCEHEVWWNFQLIGDRQQQYHLSRCYEVKLVPHAFIATSEDGDDLRLADSAEEMMEEIWKDVISSPKYFHQTTTKAFRRWLAQPDEAEDVCDQVLEALQDSSGALRDIAGHLIAEWNSREQARSEDFRPISISAEQVENLLTINRK